MTAQGSPISVLRRALRAGSLGAVDMALFEIQHLDLQDALEVILLLSKEQDPRLDRWAARWVERVAAKEHDELQALVAQIPDEHAVEELRAWALHSRQRPAGAGVRSGKPSVSSD